MKITKIHARQILDSRGNPTIETDVSLENNMVGRASVPSGASTGTHEAMELRDNDSSSYDGKSEHKAVDNVNNEIATLLHGFIVTDQEKVDRTMIEADGTESKSRFGANSILSVSLAVAHAGALAQDVPLFSYVQTLSNTPSPLLPMPLMNIINGGKHADFATDIQECMIVPIGATTFAKALEMGSEVFHVLGLLLEEKGYPTTVGDEGGYGPEFKNGNTEALDFMVQAVEKAGFVLGKDIVFALDVAASELFRGGKYELKADKKELTTIEMIGWLSDLTTKYPIVSLEDGLSQDDWGGWKELTQQLGGKVQLVGDDLLVTNTKFLQRAIDEKCGNAILIKPNQIGTLTETIDAVLMAKNASFNTIMSHRSGETEDTTIAHLAVGLACGQIKTGSLSRSERVAKYNELLRIEENLGDHATMATPLLKK